MWLLQTLRRSQVLQLLQTVLLWQVLRLPQTLLLLPALPQARPPLQVLRLLRMLRVHTLQPYFYLLGLEHRLAASQPSRPSLAI
jgi:hypothetical protein